MARRAKFRRTAPDRGWVVGHSGPTIITPNPGADDSTYVFQLFDFADIDPEALTGRIEQDKSDWFIKRVILNVATAASIDGLGDRDHTRFFEWAVGTIGVEDSNAMQGPPSQALFGPEAYNLWARLFQTGVAPSYMPGILPYATADLTGDLRLAVTSATGSEAAGWLASAPWWGSGMISEDFTVSNAGLRNNQLCAFAVNLCRGPHGFQWDDADSMSITWWYQVLVQKRRA